MNHTTSTSTTPAHLRPESCHVCGWPKEDHQPGSVWSRTDGHKFWSNADADTEAREHDRRATFAYSNGASTPEAAYVAEYIPEAVAE